MRDIRRTSESRHTRSQKAHLRYSNGRLTIAYLAPAIDGASQVQWAGVVDAAQKHNVNLICFPGQSVRFPTDFRAQANVLYNLVTAKNVDGIVSWASSIGNYIDADEIRSFHERYRPLPVVTIGRTLEGIPGLLMDSYEGMYEAVAHLIEVHGYRRLAFIRGPEGHFYAQERYRAYTEVLEDYGLPIDPNLVSLPDSWEPSSGMEAMRLLLDKRRLHPQTDFEAVVSANDHLLLGALEVLQTRGIRVPGEVAILGFDDIMEAGTNTPPLTSVAVPYYEVGYRAVETVLDLIEGKHVPAEAVVPSKLVVRQSCGCLDPAVAQAVVDRIEGKDQVFKMALATTREQILEGMRQGLGAPFEGLAPDWDEQLLDAFSTALNEEKPDRFLRAFDDILRQAIETEGNPSTSLRTGSRQDMALWQNVVSAMHRRVLPCFGDSETDILHRAENLWRQARVMIGETAQRAQAYREFQAEQRAQTLREIGQALITTFDVPALMEILARELSRVGIPSCYVSLYEDPHTPTEWARLMLAYNEEGQIKLTVGEQRFPSHHLMPEGMSPRKRRYSLVTEPLYFREDQIGFVLFEIGPRDGNVYEVLRGELSSALQGALLVQQVQEHSVELAAAYEEIRILNDQLQEENLRMSAELSVARRLQEMILPAPKELQQIKGLEVVGYMKPADEVGGDYYDIFKGEGGLHIGIGDVTGHGLESGVLMLMTQTAIRTLVDHGETDPVIFLNTLNRVLYDNIQRMNVDKTLTLAFINYHQGQLKIIGQHEELLVVRQQGQLERIDTLNLGFPIGLEKDIARWVAEATVTLQPGDGVVLYTDGITEAANIHNELYGLERLCDVVSRNWDISAEDTKQTVIDDVIRHIGKQKVYDDLTLVVLKQQ